MMHEFNKSDIQKAIDSLEIDLKNKSIIAGLYLKALTDEDKTYWANKFEEQTAKDVLIHKRIAELKDILSKPEIKYPRVFCKVDIEGRN
jgi:hypothetical protein